MQCLSTHGGAGYAPGSRWDNGAIICGACGERIENPPPIATSKNGEPLYPDFIDGLPREKTIRRGGR